MSTAQALICSRCRVKQALFKCGLCHDTPPLCEDCRVPHYRLMHHYDASVGENIRNSPTEEPPWGIEESVMIISSQLTPRVVPKGGMMKDDRRAITKFIRERICK